MPQTAPAVTHQCNTKVDSGRAPFLWMGLAALLTLSPASSSGNNDAQRVHLHQVPAMEDASLVVGRCQLLSHFM